MLGQQTSVGGVVALLVFLLTLAVAAWMWGAVQWSTGPRKWAVAAIAAALLVGTGEYTLDFAAAPPIAEVAGAPGEVADEMWRPFDQDEVEAQWRAGRIVLVVFTADWCITCKVNEAGVLASDTLHRAFAEHDVATYRANWTRRDERIRRVLARHGQAGVPMYLLYHPASPEGPLVLPELLTESLVLDVLNGRSASFDAPTP